MPRPRIASPAPVSVQRASSTALSSKLASRRCTSSKRVTSPRASSPSGSTLTPAASRGGVSVSRVTRPTPWLNGSAQRWNSATMILVSPCTRLTMPLRSRYSGTLTWATRRLLFGSDSACKGGGRFQANNSWLGVLAAMQAAARPRSATPDKEVGVTSACSFFAPQQGFGIAFQHGGQLSQGAHRRDALLEQPPARRSWWATRGPERPGPKPRSGAVALLPAPYFAWPRGKKPARRAVRTVRPRRPCRCAPGRWPAVWRISAAFCIMSRAASKVSPKAARPRSSLPSPKALDTLSRIVSSECTICSRGSRARVR